MLNCSFADFNYTDYAFRTPICCSWQANQNAYKTCRSVANYRDKTFQTLWKSKLTISYIESDWFNVKQIKCLLNFFQVGFVIHVAPGHHDYFAGRNRIGIKMVHQQTINHSIAQWLYFWLVSLHKNILTLRVVLIHWSTWFLLRVGSLRRCFIFLKMSFIFMNWIPFKLLTLKTMIFTYFISPLYTL